MRSNGRADLYGWELPGRPEAFRNGARTFPGGGKHAHEFEGVVLVIGPLRPAHEAESAPRLLLFACHDQCPKQSGARILRRISADDAWRRSIEASQIQKSLADF